MANARINRATVLENSAAIIAGLLRNLNDGAVLNAADVSSLTLRSYAKANTADATGTLVVPAGADPDTYAGTSLDPADAMTFHAGTTYLAQQAGSDDGLNLVIELDGSYWPDGGKVYRVEVKVVPTSGDAWYECWDITTLNVFSE